MATNEVNECGKCRKKINFRKSKSVYCDGNCKKVFHKVCTSLSDEDYDDIIKNEKIGWFCQNCKIKRNKRRSILNMTGTYATPSSELDINDENESENEAQMSSTLSNISDTVKKIYEKQENLEKEIKDLRKTINDYKIIADNLLEENIALRNDNEMLKRKINNVEHKIDIEKQYELSKNLLFFGLNENSDNNYYDQIKKVTDFIGVHVEEKDIEKICMQETKATNSGISPPIIVKFKQLETKQNIMTQKKGKLINTHIINQGIPKRNIYINEQLTNHKQYMFKLVRDARREGKIEFAWVKNGELYARKNKDSKPIKIKYIDQIHDL